MQTQEEVLIPFAFDKVKPAIDALKMTGDYLAGDETALPKPHRYQSSDLYKIMEGAAYILRQNPENIELESKMDSIIDIIANAQQEDGYLYVPHITGAAKDHAAWGGGGMGDRPYSWVVHSHELYNMGHMYEAAIAYYQATGKDKWLNVAAKNAQHINRVFFEGDPAYNNGVPINQAPGHQELEIALAKLYRITGDTLYLNMAQRFLDIRGVSYIPDGDQYLSPTYAQQHLPVAQQKEAVGHAVRAAYMYSAMADISALKGTREYEEALTHIWQDIVDRKMSITGGLGAVRGIEGFGAPFRLPNREAHNETCAAVGNVMFNYRLFLMTGEARFLDVAEVALFNNALAGVSLEGDRFFYVNPLEADGIYDFNHGATGRSQWFNTACCPSNLARLVPQIAGMMYAVDRRSIYITLFSSSKTTLQVGDTRVAITQKTDYPFDGTVVLRVDPELPSRFAIQLRMPTWSGTGQFVPGELYSYIKPTGAKPEVKINGTAINEYEQQDGFLVLSREWEQGDEVQLTLPMPVQFSRAAEQIEETRNKIAISRGPLLYCAEALDNDVDILKATVDPQSSKAVVSSINGGVLNGIPGLTLESGENRAPLQLVPYYAWNNRGDGAMAVWIQQEDQ